MGLRALGGTASVLGGAAWIADDAVGRDPLHWVGLGLLAVALAAAGAGLVSSSAVWLRAIVAVALPLLLWSVTEVVREGGADAETVDVVLGIAAVLLGLFTLLRSRPPRQSHKH